LNKRLSAVLGSFANGAVTAAMSYAFGSLGSRGRSGGGSGFHDPTDAEMAAYIEASGFYDLENALAFEDTWNFLKDVIDVRGSFGAQLGFDARLGVFTLGAEVNLFALEKEFTQGGPVMLNQEVSGTIGAPRVGQFKGGFGRRGRGDLFSPYENRSSYRGFSRNAQGEFVVGVGVAVGAGIHVEANLTRIRRHYQEWRGN
jgi:hypothetical protein